LRQNKTDQSNIISTAKRLLLRQWPLE